MDDADRRYMTPQQLFERTGISTKTWQRKRLDGTGPRYVRMGMKILYLEADFEAWAASRTFKHRAAEAVATSRAA